MSDLEPKKHPKWTKRTFQNRTLKLIDCMGKRKPQCTLKKWKNHFWFLSCLLMQNPKVPQRTKEFQKWDTRPKSFKNMIKIIFGSIKNFLVLISRTFTSSSKQMFFVGPSQMVWRNLKDHKGSLLNQNGSGHILEPYLVLYLFGTFWVFWGTFLVL